MSSDYYQGFLERGRLHESGAAGYEKNYSRAYKSYKKVPSHIERGESHYRIGNLLMKGDEFMSRDYNKARAYYEEAALHGHGGARYALGQMNEGVYVNYALAKRYYHQALDVGYTKAAKNIGIMFLRAPSGVLYDLNRAKIYLERFEEHHKADADVHIAFGDYYRLTRCKDYISKAFDRYNKAIALNEGLGYYWIGQLWEESSPANLSKAVGYYQEGKALSNDAKCMWRLAQLHVSGQVLKKDIDAARILFSHAASKGCKEAQKELDELNAEIANGKASKNDAVKAANDVGSKDTPAKAVDPAPSSNFQPLSWDRMRACFEANGTMKQEEVPVQSNTSTSEPDEQLVRIIELPAAKHGTNVTNFQVKSKIHEKCSANPSKFALQDSDHEPARGYKFKTKADLRKQLKKAEVSSPLPPLHILELSTAMLQSNQAQITAALDTTNKALFKNVLSLTLKLNKLSIENEQSAAIINSNNEDIAKKFEQVEDSIEKHVYQRLEVLEKKCAEKDRTIEMLMSKLNAQSQQLETLMRSIERR
ncbi:hypothetical protein MBANPS3_004632 [Mucor bainieri]